MTLFVESKHLSQILTAITRMNPSDRLLVSKLAHPSIRWKPRTRDTHFKVHRIDMTDTPFPYDDRDSCILQRLFFRAFDDNRRSIVFSLNSDKNICGINKLKEKLSVMGM